MTTSPLCIAVDAYGLNSQQAQHLHDCGVRGAGAYFGPADPGKVVTPHTIEALISAGIFVWGQYELSAGSWRGGRPAGLQHGAETRAWARNTLGTLWSDEATIFATYDQNAGAADHAVAQAYQEAFNQGQNVPAAPGAYADGDLLYFLRDQVGLIKHTWLSDSTAFTLSRLFAAQGNPSIVQYFGDLIPGLSGVDKNEIFEHDVGQMPRPTSPPPPRRAVFMDHFFFTILDSDKFNPSTVFESDGIWMRELAGMDEYHVRAFLLLAGGYTADQVKIGQLHWAQAQALILAH